ncbi:hypothetical protein SK128_008567 [Halocaridina rubra]|uniref:Chitin-binding type-2 domain-containing protein n=1 Tax=Halocaridina rubra TaxID=373956 RepID=A0AAN8XGU7_HALRR
MGDAAASFIEMDNMLRLAGHPKPTYFQDPLHTLRFYRGVYEVERLEVGGMATNATSVYSRGHGNAIYQCKEEGFFLKADSCRDYYQCEKLPLSNDFILYEIFCHPGTKFEYATKTCSARDTFLPRCDAREYTAFIQKSRLNNGNTIRSDRGDISNLDILLEKNLPTLVRKKRFPFALVFAGFSALGSLAGASASIAGTVLANKRKASKGEQGTETSLQNIENRLTGLDGKIKDLQFGVMESQIENKFQSEVLQNMISKGSENNRLSFDVIQKLVKDGVLENRFHTAVTQGLISQGNIANEFNFAQVQVSIGKVRNFVSKEIQEVKSTIRKGFEELSTTIDQSRTEPLITQLLNDIKIFKQKTNHIMNIPKKQKGDEIKRHGGYLTYLESNTLPNTLNNIIYQNLAIPKDASDLQAKFVLELLVDGLTVHAHMLSAIVSSYAYLADEALEERNLEDFNAYMMRVSSSIERIKTSIIDSDHRGLLEDVMNVLNSVHQNPYATSIHGLSQLISEKKAQLNQLKSDVNMLLSDNTELYNPGTIQGKPDFSSSNIPVPTGPWQANRKVSYAIQIASENGLSRVGRWSSPYTISNKGCPLIKIPTVDPGLLRLIYRKFDNEKPELVAVVSDNSQTALIDIGRDMLNAASRPNEDIAVQEITTLIDNGGDVNVMIENEMTPLHYAAKYGNVNVMKLLVERGANIKAKAADNQEALHYAAIFGTEQGIRFLISKGADSNAQTKLLGLSALHIAVANGHVDASNALIENNAFLNIKDNNGLTPLHMSIVGNGVTTDLLLGKQTIDVNAVDENGLTPLHYAARGSRKEIVSKLLQHKDTDVNVRTSSLLAPLHFASISGDAVITDLLRAGAEISATDEDGSTPLHYGSFYGNRNAVLELLMYDTLLESVKNNAGKTALDFATENGKHSVIEVFGKDINTLTSIIQQSLEDQATAENNQPQAVNKYTIDDSLVKDCDSSLVERMVQSSMETCERINDVETYVNLVMGAIPLKRYYENNKDYTVLFRNYDDDLREAQQHAKLWRNGDSIVSGIRQTFDLAKEFEVEFNRKLEINQERLDFVAKNVDQAKKINETKHSIQYIEVELEAAREARLGVQENQKKLIKYFDAEIQELEENLAVKRRELKQNFTLIPVLEELIDFMTFVKRDCTKIRDMSIRTRSKTENFRDLLEQDKGAFIRHSQVAKVAYDKLKNDTIKNEERLKQLDIDREQKEKRIRDLQQNINEHQNRLKEAHQSLMDMRKDLAKKVEESNKLTIAGGVLSIFIPIVGVPMLIAANAQQRQAASQNQEAMEINRQEVDIIKSQMELIYSDMNVQRQLIANSSSNSDKIKLEMNVFITLDTDLLTLSSEVDKLLNAIDKAIVGVKYIHSTFVSVIRTLGDLIDVASTAKTDFERLNAKNVIYEEMSKMKCMWKDAHFNLMNLDDCTRLFKILYV